MLVCTLESPDELFKVPILRLPSAASRPESPVWTQTSGWFSSPADSTGHQATGRGPPAQQCHVTWGLVRCAESVSTPDPPKQNLHFS